MAHMVTLGAAQAALQAIANQKGKTGFEAGKKAYLDSVILCDDRTDETTPLAPIADAASVEFDIKFADDSDAKAKAAPQETDDDRTARIVRAELDRFKAANPLRRPDVRVGGESVPRGMTKYVKAGGDRAKAAQICHDFTKWAQAVTYGAKAPSAVRYCREKGYALDYGDFDDDHVFRSKAITGHSESVGADGGYLVPTEFDSELLWLREQYGVARRNARIVPMGSDSKEYSRKRSSHTAYYTNEGGTNTTTKMAFDRIRLVAKKLRIDGYLTSELSEDAAVRIGDEVMNDIAETFSYKEDVDAFKGDGTSTYGGIVGLQQAFVNLGTFANSLGVYDLAGSAWTSVTSTHIVTLMSRLPAWADGPNTKWFCNKAFYHTVLQRIEVSAGGATMMEVREGSGPQPRFMGYPVEFVQALPTSGTADVPDLFFGDMSKACDLGDRRGLTFKTTDIGGNAWANDEIAYKATQRWDWNVHDIGNNTSTAADQKAGGLVALIVL